MLPPRPILGTLTALLLLACSSAYSLPNETLALRRTLDEAKAKAIVKESLKPNAEGRGGVYLANAVPAIWPSIPTQVNVSGTFIEFVVDGPSDVIGRALNDECVRPSNALEYENDSIFPLGQQKPTMCPARLDLRRLSQISVAETEADDPGGRLVAGYRVSLNETPTRYIIINVTRARLNELMAALTHYSPAATLKWGSAF
jgi:hypothetical protein